MFGRKSALGLWKEISKEGLLLLNNVSFSVGDGKRVRFWKDIWCGNTPLCEAFPSLFDLVGSKDARVADYWDPMGEEGGWTPHFLRPFNDWEVEEVERFLSSIQGKRLDADVEDRMVWKETKNEIFTVKSLYKSLVHSCAVSFPCNIIWSPYVPTKVSFFAWVASWEKVLTQDQLKRRGWILANRCCFCCVEEETINHILVHCSKAKILWDLVFSLFGVNWVLPFTVRDTLLSWYVSFKDKKYRKVWRAVPLCLFWMVWKERNRIVFDNEVLSIQRLKNFCVCNLLSWAKSSIAIGPLTLFNFVEWLGSC